MIKRENFKCQKKAITTEACPMCLLIARGIHMLLFTEEKKPKPKRNAKPSNLALV